MGNRSCAAEGCRKPVKACGWCSGHYERWRKTGDVNAGVPLRVTASYAADARCAVNGCENSMRGGSRGWCEKHYECWRRYGDPLHVRHVLSDDLEAFESMVDRSGGLDACHPWTGRQHPDGYGWAKKDGQPKLAHVAAWEFENGPKPTGAQLDHECHNRAVRDGACRPGKCPHRLCCNLEHIILRASKDEHFSATEPWDRSAWARSRAKFTEAQVREIRRLLPDGKPVSARAALAERYGVSTATIYRIATGKAYVRVSDEP